jgi:hypothetical protein
MKTTGLTLKEAVESGRPFGRKNDGCNALTKAENPLFSWQDVVAEDWQIEPLPPKQIWTREEVEGIKKELLGSLGEPNWYRDFVIEVFQKAGL